MRCNKFCVNGEHYFIVGGSTCSRGNPQRLVQESVSQVSQSVSCYVGENSIYNGNDFGHLASRRSAKCDSSFMGDQNCPSKFVAMCNCDEIRVQHVTKAAENYKIVRRTSVVTTAPFGPAP